MKKLIFISFLFISFYFSSFAEEKNESSQESSAEKNFQDFDKIFYRHHKLMNSIRDRFFKNDHGFFDDDKFSDFFEFDEPRPSDQGNLSLSWRDSKKGKTLVVKHSGPDLDIKVEGGLISIQSKNQVQEKGFSSYSQFSQVISVPKNCDSTKVEIKEKAPDSIEIFFPYLNGVKPSEVKPKGLVPLSPSEDDIEI